MFTKFDWMMLTLCLLGCLISLAQGEVAQGIVGLVLTTCAATFVWSERPRTSNPGPGTESDGPANQN